MYWNFQSPPGSRCPRPRTGQQKNSPGKLPLSCLNKLWNWRSSGSVRSPRYHLSLWRNSRYLYEEIVVRVSRWTSAVYFRVAGANNFIVRDARVLLASPWSRWRPTMRPYSMDLRERVAAAIDAGEGSQRQVAKRFRVSVSFVTRLVQRRRDAGTLAPKPHGGGPRPALGFP